jgi:hypothetical protein
MTRQQLRGLIIAPIVAPVGYWLAMAIAAAARGESFSIRHAVRELGVILLFGMPVAYVAAFGFGLPSLMLLERLGQLRAWIVAMVGIVAGILVFGVFELKPHGDLFRVRMPLVLAASLGGLAGAVYWRLVRSAKQGSA